jgi:hypothetical protein
MARRTQTYAIRLAVEGGGQVKAELVSVGQSGEQSLKRIESAGERASGGLKGLGRQAELLRAGTPPSLWQPRPRQSARPKVDSPGAIEALRSGQFRKSHWNKASMNAPSTTAAVSSKQATTTVAACSFRPAEYPADGRAGHTQLLDHPFPVIALGFERPEHHLGLIQAVERRSRRYR